MKFVNSSVVFFLVATALLSSCSINSWDRNLVTHEISFKKLRQVEPSGILIGLTDQNFNVDTFEVVKGWVHFYPDWKLSTFQTAQSIQVGTVSLPPGTWVTLDSLQAISRCVLPKDLVIQDILCQGGGGITGVYTGFYPTGQLKGCYPADDLEIDGIPCSSTMFVPVYLYENGRLESCRLSRSWQQAGQTFKKGTHIRVAPDGKITEQVAAQ